MGLLLFVWLAGDALTSLLTGRDVQSPNTVRGRAFGESVTFGDMQRSFNDLEVLSALGVNWRVLWASPAGALAPNDYYRYQFITDVRDPQKNPLTEVEWYMLDAEARHKDIFVPQDTVDEFKERLGINPTVIANVQKQHPVSVREIDQAIRAFVRVLRMISEATEGVKISEADVQNYVRQTREKARVDVVVIEAAKLIDEAYQPTEAEMKELFEKNKDRDPVVGSMNEFGYRLPERVQIEYIQVSQAELAKSQAVREEEAFDYWTEHKAEFLKPATQPATAPTTQTRPADRQPYGTFTEAKSHVIERMRAERARQEALRLAREMIAKLAGSRLKASRAQTTQPGSEEIPESEKSSEFYPELVKTMSARYPGVLKYARTELVDADGLSANPEIGRANAFAGERRPVPVRRVAFAVSGLTPPDEEDAELARVYRAVYETCVEPLVDSDGNAYVFRNVQALPKQAPASWQDVQDALKVDVRKQRAYAEAERLAKALAEQAAKTSLRAAFDADTALKTKLGEDAYKTPAPFARKMAWQMEMFSGQISGIGGGEKAVDLCFDLAGKSAQADRVRASDLDGRGWMVIEGREILPINSKEYEDQRGLAVAVLTAKRQVEFLKDWFSPERIKDRVGWVDAESETQAEGQEGSTTQPAEKTQES